MMQNEECVSMGERAEHDVCAPILCVHLLVTGYGKKPVLNGVSMAIPTGQLTAMIGHNGAGKSTLLRAMFGLLPIWQGELRLDGNLLGSPKPCDLLRKGVAYVPQGNRVFSNLSVRENLEVSGMNLASKHQHAQGIDHAMAIFPQLKGRLRQRAATLSGGEKQMLALANALVLSPRLLLLDEPSLGLAPLAAKATLGLIHQVNQEHGVTILMVEQRVRESLEICHHVCCLRLGQITYEGPPQPLRSDSSKLKQVFL